MIKYLTHKLKTQSINEENFNQKIDCHDSGTESDGDLDIDDFDEKSLEHSMSSRQNTLSPECSAESPAFLGSTSNLLYDQHSSEEELEVIMTKPLETLLGMSYSNENLDHNKKFKIIDTEKTPKRCTSSTFLEKRKRSLAHNSDEEVRQFSETQSHCHHNMLAPVNFRTSPPIEALKPHRGHLLFNYQNQNWNSPHHNQSASVQHRSTTPLILVEAGRGIENIRISCDSPLTTSSSTPSSSSLDLRSTSPPTKVFAVSPRHRNRTPRNHQLQRLQRRPCLDFDKMQVSNRMISSPGV